MLARKRWVVGAWSAVGTALLAAMPLRAAEDVLKLVPEDAWGFVVANKLSQADAALATLARQAKSPFSPLEFLDKRSGIAEGLDVEGSGLIAVLPGEGPDSPPAVLVVLPATDYEKLIKSLDAKKTEGNVSQVQVRERTYLVAPWEDYAVFADTKDRPALDETLKSAHGPSDAVAAFQPWLMENDVALVITKSGVEAIGEKLLKGLEQAKAAVKAASGRTAAHEQPAEREAEEADKDAPRQSRAMPDAAEALNAYVRVIRAAKDEIVATAGGLDVDGNGITHITWRTRFQPGGKASRLLADMETPEQNVLAGLPDVPFVFAGGAVIGEGLSKAITKFSVNMMEAMPNIYGLKPEQAQEMGQLAAKVMAPMRQMSMLMAVGQADEPLYASFLALMRVDDAQAYLETYQEYVEQVSELVGDQSFMGQMTARKIQVGERPGLRVMVDATKMKEMSGIPDVQRIFNTLFGEAGKLNVFLVTADEHTIVVGYVNRKLLKKTLADLDADEQGFVASGRLRRVAAALPEEASCRAYFSPQGLSQFINRMSQLTPEKAGFELPDFPKSPPIGWSGTVEGNAFHEHVVILPGTVEALGEFARAVPKKIQEQRKKAREATEGAEDRHSKAADQPKARSRAKKD